MKVWECECGYRSLQPGRCRSHPYPARAMGPDMGDPVEYVRVGGVAAAIRDEANRELHDGAHLAWLGAAEFVEREFASPATHGSQESKS